MSETPGNSGLSPEDRERILQTTAIVREVLKDGSRTPRKSPLDLLRHPLLLLLAGTIASGIIVHEFQSRQARLAEREKAKDALLMEISTLSGRLLARAEEVLGLHETPIADAAQIVATNKAYNEAGDLYAASLLKTENSLKILFDEDVMISSWNAIREEFEALNERLDLLHEFKTTDISMEHSKRMAACREKIAGIDLRLKDYGRLIIEKLKSHKPG